jgi:hypothetical protein
MRRRSRGQKKDGRATRTGGPALFSGKRLWCNFLRLFARQHVRQVGAICHSDRQMIVFKAFL